ncbi:MAG: hypothetical protein H0U75_10915 [Legionella sp.]|nr:hypothetical protein [Legionella sp.]
MLKVGITTLALLVTSPLWAFICDLTVIKDSCWAKAPYDVTIDVIDSGASIPSKLATLTMSREEILGRQVFECKASQILTYRARFKPAMWQHDANLIYSSKSSLSLPALIHPGDTSWNLTLCYSTAFSGVPLPTEAISMCTCDYSSVPSIRLIQKKMI